jgi:choline dehydrogenase/4-pyridoxate dehydrogenase
LENSAAPGFVLFATYAGRHRCTPSWSARSPRGENATTDAALEAHIRATCITVHHPLGTCKMGVASDLMAVVDAELRVHGTEGLRIVDGSVMPDLVGANINAPIIMIAEKAADLIRGRRLLEPARIAAAEYARH